MTTSRLVQVALVWLGIASIQATVPGTTQTLSGYDTELGEDAICWTGASNALSHDDNTSAVLTPFPNPVVENFTLYGETKLLLECPAGIWLKGYAPSEFGSPPDYVDGIRPRTKEWYNYTVEFTLDLSETQGDTLISDDTPTIVAVQVIVCELGKVGFCSPFIHEEANDRLAAQGITKSPDRGDRHGGTHVHSPYENVTVFRSRVSQSFNVTVPLLINDPGDFYAIAALQFYTFDSNRQTTGEEPYAEYRYDVANALDKTLITYEDVPDILVVSTGVKIASYVLISMAGAAILFLLYHTVKNRNNNVIRLSQGNFLIVFLIAALVATVSAVFLNPKSDVWCNIVDPLILIPLQLLFSILIGRLWRIQAVISPVLMKKLHREQSVASGFGRAVGRVTSFKCCSKSGGDERQSVRRTITGQRLALVVALFTLPQVIMQTVGLSVNPSELKIEFNSNESIGRAVCSSRIEPWKSYHMYAFILLLILFILLLVVSYASRKLPSLLNETASICNSTIESLVAIAVAFCIIGITDSPTTPPDVPYLCSVLLVLILTVNHTWRIMLPKLRMVWRGQNVVISKLVMDQRRKEAEKQELLTSGVTVTGFTPGTPQVNASSVNSDGLSASLGASFGASFNRSSTSGLEEFDSEFSNGSHGEPKHDDTKEEYTKQDIATALPKDNNIMRASSNYEDDILVFEDEDPVSEELGKQVPPPAVEKKTRFAGIDPPLSSLPDGKDEDIEEGMGDTSAPSSQHQQESSPKLNRATSSPDFKKHKDDDKLSSGDRRSSLPTPSSPVATAEAKTPTRRHRHQHHPILITDDETPTRRLVLRMVDVQEVLTRVNCRILSGLTVDHEDWKTLQEASVDLGTVFQNEVHFKWDEGDDMT